MARKCAPGVFCIENTTILLILISLVIGGYLFFMSTKNGIQRASTPVVLLPSIGGISTRNIEQGNMFDVFSPPLKNATGDLRGLGADVLIPPPGMGAFNVETRASGIPVNVETRATGMSYGQMGILTKQRGRESDNLILPLMGRKHMAGSDKWQYYTMSNSGAIQTKLPLSRNGKSCTSEYGCPEITNGESIYVEGYDDIFKATIYENGRFNYIPYI
jgi:hypothetical protein